MARLHDAGPETATGDDAEVVARILARRGGELTPLDRMLLHSPPIADGWNALLGAVRTAGTMPDDMRELAILRIAALNGAGYEWRSHEPLGRRAGLDDDAVAAAAGDRPATGLDARRRAVLAYTDAMTREVTVPDAVFDALRAEFDDRDIVELTATVGAYNLVSRFLVALQVGEDERDAA